MAVCKGRLEQASAQEMVGKKKRIGEFKGKALLACKGTKAQVVAYELVEL